MGEGVQIFLKYINIVHTVISNSHELLVTGFDYLLAINTPRNDSTNIQEIIHCV